MSSKSTRHIPKKSAKRLRRLRRCIAVPVFLIGVLSAAGGYLLRPRLCWMPLLLLAFLCLLEGLLLCLKKGAPKVIYIGIAVLCVACGVVASDKMPLVPFGDGTVRTDVRAIEIYDGTPDTLQYLTQLEEIRIFDPEITDFTPYMNVQTLHAFDVRGNYAFTQETCERFKQALPDCSILWSIPINGQYYDSDTDEVDLTQSDLSTQELKSILDAGTGFRFRYCVDLFGQRLPMDADALTLTDYRQFDWEAMQAAMPLLPDLKAIDLSCMRFNEKQMDYLKKTWPDIAFCFSFDTPIGTVKSDQTTLYFDTNYTLEDFTAMEGYYSRLPNLQTVDARMLTMTQEQIDAFKAAHPGIELLTRFTVYGVTTFTNATRLDLDNQNIQELETFEAALKYLPCLDTVSMVDCNLSEDTIMRLRETHPGLRFIWRVHFGIWSLRTDATAFSTLLYAKNKYSFTEKDFAPLQYCTDLMFLDIGHLKVHDISFLRGLTKLRVLILADLGIRDMSPLIGLNDLEYVEMFRNKFTDISALANKPKLVDLNLHSCKISNPEVLTTIKSLQRLWIGHCGFSDATIRMICKALPDCQVIDGGTCTGNGWRGHKHYDTILKMYETGEYIPFD